MTEAVLLSGKAIKEKLLADTKREVDNLVARHGFRPPKLVALKVGENAGGELYLSSQKRACEAVGARHEIVALPSGATQEAVLSEIEKQNNDDTVDGILIQMPLPKHLKADLILGAVQWSKDVEGITPHSLGLLAMAKPVMLPCTPASCVAHINASGIDLYGKEVVVVGASVSVGKPVSILLLDRMATVTICRSSAGKSGTLEGHVRRADVLVAALGRPAAIKGDWIKPGAVVVDVGINRVDGKTVGDVDFDAARKRAKAITPVPGGVGPVTSAILMQNLVKGARLRRDKTQKS